MSTKKSFSIPTGLATGIRSSIQSATTNQGQLHYDMMSIDVIETDPNNPRKLSVTSKEIINGLNKHDKDYEKKAKEFEALNDLAESIKKVGVRNAIEVYKDDNKYRIISGERRYLASILAGQKYIPARINQKLDEIKVRYIQWVENINRQDLSLWEKYNNLLTLEKAYNMINSAKFTSDTLKELLGVSDAQSYRYLSLLNADDEVIELVKAGRLTNLKIIQELASIKNKSSRIKMLDELKNSTENTTSMSTFKRIKEKNSLKRNTINLGKVNNLNTAKYVMNSILNDLNLIKFKERFHNINWDSTKAINKAFKDLLNLIENEIDLNEKTNEV